MRRETDSKGIVRYYNELGQLHREDGPAIIYPEYIGCESYWFKGKLHRIDGPAVKSESGSFWWFNGKKHRIDGPAIEWISGEKSWYIHGQEYSEEEYRLIIFSLYGNQYENCG